MYTSENESFFFLSFLKPHHHVLEYGSGQSTNQIAKHVKTLISIEHQNRWYQKLNTELENNVTLILAKPDLPYEEGKDCGSYEQFKTYINAPINYGPYDIVLIDGRARVECANICSKFSNSDTFIFIHDFDRKEYQVINEILLKIKQVETMALFKLKS